MAGGENRVKTFGWAARDTSGVFSPFEFTRRATREDDVRFIVLYCGICHSDLHAVKDDMGMTTFPVVPRHEIVGEVTEVGSKATKFKVGDKVGVGCFVGSCGSCEQCANDLETYCPKVEMTYLSPEEDGTTTRGGFSNEMVVKEHFAIKWPENLPPTAAPRCSAPAALFTAHCITMGSSNREPIWGSWASVGWATLELSLPRLWDSK